MQKIFLILIFFVFSPANIIIIKTQNPKSSVDHNPIPRLLDTSQCSSQIIDYLNGIYLSDELISDLVKNNFSTILETNSNKVLNKCLGIKNGVYYINDFKKNITKKDKNYFRRKNNFSEDSKTIDELILNKKLLSKIEKENNNMHKKISKKYKKF